MIKIPIAQNPRKLTGIGRNFTTLDVSLNIWWWKYVCTDLWAVHTVLPSRMALGPTHPHLAPRLKKE